MKIVFFVLVAMSACSSDFPLNSPVFPADASSMVDGVVLLNQGANVHAADVPQPCTTTCEDNNPCTTDSCEDGQCVHTSKGWDCWPCESDTDCTISQKTCQDGGLIHKDGYDFCLPDKTCHTFHQVEACPDDNDPCTIDECGYNDDSDVVCNHTPVYCEDANACTDDICELKTGKCLHSANGNGCGGGGDIEPCKTVKDCQNLGGACLEENCVQGQCTHYPPDCDDKNSCTNDTCHPITGCGHQAIPNCK